MNDSDILTARRSQYLRRLSDALTGNWKNAYNCDRAQREWALAWGYVEADNRKERITEKGRKRLIR